MPPPGPGRWLTAALLSLAAWCGNAVAITVGPVDLYPTADCSGQADLQVSYTGAGSNHFEFGLATDANGATIGTFGPSTDAHAAYTGQFVIDITTAQPDNAFIGSYGWVGGDPPSSADSVEFFVLYNCTNKIVRYRCSGPYGSCPQTAPAALALIAATGRYGIPTLSEPALAVLMAVVALVAAVVLRRRVPGRPN